MGKIKSWLTGATLAAAVLRVGLAVTAAILADASPLVALCAAAAAELGLATEPLE